MAIEIGEWGFERSFVYFCHVNRPKSVDYGHHCHHLSIIEKLTLNRFKMAIHFILEHAIHVIHVVVAAI